MKNTPETWLPVPGYQGKYLISDQGNIRKISLNTIEKPIQVRKDRAGYLTVRLYHDKKVETRFIHRLVAEVFISNPEGKSIANHRNGIKSDNCAANLEWATFSENIKHAHSTGLIPAKRKRRTVVDRCRNRRYAGVAEAARANGIPVSTCRQYLVGTLRNPTCLRFENN
jgi:NUMOD4 motif/HNH endonuclease